MRHHHQGEERISIIQKWQEGHAANENKTKLPHNQMSFQQLVTSNTASLR